MISWYVSGLNIIWAGAIAPRKLNTILWILSSVEVEFSNLTPVRSTAKKTGSCNAASVNAPHSELMTLRYPHRRVRNAADSLLTPVVLVGVELWLPFNLELYHLHLRGFTLLQ